jgi:hypothetical protein
MLRVTLRSAQQALIGVFMRPPDHRNPKFSFAFLLLILCSFAPVLAAQQTNLTGFWVFRVPTGDGNFRETFLDLKQDGERITGKLLAGTREVAINDGTLKNGALHFVSRLETARRRVT